MPQRRQFEVYGRALRASGISNGQFYNLRKSTTYQRRRTTFKKTRSTAVGIGERRKPAGGEAGLAGGHGAQGDKDGEKGVYHINLVDEVLQWEHVATVRHLPTVSRAGAQGARVCPFKVLGADNGSEYINRKVAENQLHVPEFTKSRPAHQRQRPGREQERQRGRQFGYRQLFAREINVFARDVLTPFLNFHRPCLFPTEVTDSKGRTRKRYRYQDTMTPFEKLKSLPDAERYLRPGVTIAALEDQAGATSDLDAAIALKLARARLFELIDRESDPHRRRSA